MADWLHALIPHTGAPDRLAKRLQRNDAVEIDVKGRKGGAMTCTLTYPEIDGRAATGQVRIFVPPGTNPSSRLPLVVNAGYEIEAPHLLEKGYAVCTPHAHPLNPLGRGVNLDRAILHAVRALPWIDAGRVQIQGGSAGGWMTLMLAADAFPIVCAIPDVPVVHWGYNAAYIGDQQEIAGPAAEPRLFGVHAVGAITVQAEATYGMPYDSPTYFANSPLAHLDTITAPILTVFSTADMLVPIDQVDASQVKPIDPARFPKGFSLAMTARFAGVRGKRTLLSALPRRRYERYILPTPPGMPEVPLNATAPADFKPPRPIPLPFSKTKPWSVSILDEGAPTPHTGHLKHPIGLDHEPFRRWATEVGVAPDQLTRPVLERLMKRLRGEPWRPYTIRPGGKGAIVRANALDWPEAERADVQLCLKAFADLSPAHAERLTALYDALPERDKALGEPWNAGL